MTGTAESVRHIVEEYVRRVWNEHDAAAVADFAPEITEMGGSGQPVKQVARDELVARVTTVLSLIPDHRLAVGKVVTDGEHVVWEWRLTGTFHSERGAHPVDVSGLTYWQVRDGLIINRDGVMDMVTWAWQIEIMEKRIRLLMPV
ncbi:nuclear transport factor 2 family protein [Streptomyces sp. NBC_00212]|uniref:nuclear transport factor 2 family protein n=1 Tax=Streptomyces sp. NBC_00212 TaxID=2975684 RepID=UPI002F91AA42